MNNNSSRYSCVPTGSAGSFDLYDDGLCPSVRMFCQEFITAHQTTSEEVTGSCACRLYYGFAGTECDEVTATTAYMIARSTICFVLAMAALVFYLQTVYALIKKSYNRAANRRTSIATLLLGAIEMFALVVHTAYDIAGGFMLYAFLNNNDIKLNTLQSALIVSFVSAVGKLVCLCLHWYVSPYTCQKTRARRGF
jgi:hypothetical protein